MLNITSQWFVEAASCDQQSGAKSDSGRLMLDSFKGLFLIAGLSSTSALIVFFIMFLYQNRQILVSQNSFSQKLAIMAKTFDVFKDDESIKKTAEAAVEEFNDNDMLGIYHDEGFSTTEPETLVRDTIQVLEITTS